MWKFSSVSTALSNSQQHIPTLPSAVSCCPLKRSKRCSCMAIRKRQNYSQIFVVHPQNSAGNDLAPQLQNTISFEQADVKCGRKIMWENFGHRFSNSTGDLTVILTPLNRHVYFTFPSGKKCAITESARL